MHRPSPTDGIPRTVTTRSAKPRRAARLIPLLLVGAWVGLSISACQDDGPSASTQGTFVKPLTASGISDAIEVLNPSEPTQPFYHSFGTVSFGQQFIHTVKLRNLESKPITILRTHPACACTRVKTIRTQGPSGEQIKGKLDQKDNILTVPAGAEFEIDILVDTNRTAPNVGRLAIMRIITDSEEQHILQFEIHFLPEELFQKAEPYLDLGAVPLGGGAGSMLQVFAHPHIHQARLLEVVEASKGLEAELQLIAGYEANWQLVVTPIGQTRKGPLNGHVILSHSDKEGQGTEGRLKIPVKGRVVDPIMLYPLNLSFGIVPYASEKRLTASVQGLAPGHHILVQDITLSGPSAEHLEVTWEALAPDGFGRSPRVDIAVHCQKDAPKGPIQATLSIELDDGGMPLIERPLSGEVR